MWNASRFCVSSLRRGHANLLCIVPILVYVFRMEYIYVYHHDQIYTPNTNTKHGWRLMKETNVYCIYRLSPKSLALKPIYALHLYS